MKLEEHEIDSLEFLAGKGFNIEVVIPTNIPRFNNPDIFVNGETWELKGPDGKSFKTLEERFKTASSQSSNIIFDLRRSKLDEKKAIGNLVEYYRKYRKVRKLMIIKKNEELLTFHKK